MAKSQKDIKGWEIILSDKEYSRHARQSSVAKTSGILLRRIEDNLELKEGDCISFNLNRKSDYKVIGYGFVKDILFGTDQYLAVRILWFVEYHAKLDEILPPLTNGLKYTDFDVFLSPFLDSIMLEQICSKIEIISQDQFVEMEGNQTHLLQDLGNQFICRRFTNDSSTYFTDIIDWTTMLEIFKENKDEFYETLKMLVLKPKSDKRQQSVKLEGTKPISIYDLSIEETPDIIKIPTTYNKKKKSVSRIIDDEEQEEPPRKNDQEKEEESHDTEDDDNDEDDLADFIVHDSEDEYDDVLNVYDSEDDTYKPTKKRKCQGKNTSSGRQKRMRRGKYKSKPAVSLPLIDNTFGLLNDEEYSTENMLIKAKKVLGTGTELKALPCREEEFYQLYHRLEDSISSQHGCCIYVSGTPGVGKTATIREVIKQLSAQMTIQSNGIKMFNYVEINGLKLIKPQSAYEVLWKKISGESTSTSNALNFLQQHFETVEGEEEVIDEYSNKLPLVVLLDELDQIVTRNQAVMYNFFNWPTYQNSRLIVIAVANTMDLPERLLTNKISSRLGLSRIQFTSYSYEQLSEIIKHRLEQLSKQNDKLLIAKDAIEFASRKVASVSGDARRSLMICIRAVEIAEAEFMSKSNEEKKQLNGKYTVTIMHIMKAVNETSSSPVTGYLNSLSFLSKLVLASIMLRKKRSGIAEIQVGEVYDELSNQIQILLFSELKNKLKSEDLELLDIVFGEGNIHMSGSVINASLFILKDFEESGILMMQPLKMERNRLIRLNISDDEILNCFKRDSMLKEMITFI